MVIGLVPCRTTSSEENPISSSMENRVTNLFKKLTFTQQMTLPIAFVTVLVLGGMATLSATSSFKETASNARATSLEVGQRYAREMKAIIDRSFDHAELLGHSFNLDVTQRKQDRERLSTNLRELLKNEPQYLATWSAWEPNAYDGKDADFKNQPHHENSGRVYPWWVRQGGELIYKTLLNEETPDLGDWYFEPVKTKQSLLVDPYKDIVNGKEIVMTSAVYTIVDNGVVRGLVGVDISLDAIKEIVSEVKPFSDSEAYLISDKMMLVAGPNQDEVMKPYAATPELMKLIASKSLQSTDFQTERGNEQFLIIPVRIFDLNQHWTLIVKTPEKTILAAAYKGLWYQLILSFMGLLILMSVVYLVAKKSEKKLTGLSADLTESASHISENIHQLNSTGGQLADASTKAAASIEETVASIEEITSMVRLNTGNAQNAADLSADSVSLAKNGEQKITELVETMGEIAASSKKIEEIIGIIDDIAFQTNLLALNASVEAARAGEHGKGFAVVAEAVRSLAQRSASAAKDINQLISTSVGQIRQGSAMVSENGEVLKKVSQSIDKVATLNREIADASKQQSTGIEQINMAISNLDQMIQKNALEAQEIVQTATQIKDSSEVMNSTVRVLSAS